MSQICSAPCCQQVRHHPAVRGMETQGFPGLPHFNYAAYNLPNWRPLTFSDHLQNHLEHPSRSSNLLKMASQQRTEGAEQWTSFCGAGDEKHQHLSGPTSLPSYCSSRTDHCLQSPSFVDECLDYHPEQSALFNPSRTSFAHTSGLRPMDTLTMGFNPIPATTTAPPMQLDTKFAEGSSMPSYQTNVDTTQFQLVNGDDWKRASIVDFGTDDEDALSPTSTEATSHGPYTPAGLDGDAGFPEAAMRRFSHNLGSSFGSNGTDMFKHVHCNLGLESTYGSKESRRAFDAPFTNAYCGGQYGEDSAHHLTTGIIAGGLPGREIIDNKELLLSQVSFRDVDGRPSNVPLALPQRDERLSVSSRRSSSSVDSSSSSDEVNKTEAVHRRRRDRYLLKMREQGFTYKEIKRRGRFEEAESTLRGRVRVLTKDKSERVRRPEWNENDVRLLRRGVAHHKKLRSEGAYNRHRDGKLPWGHISTWMKEHGSSYTFAPATCKKKYDEILGGRRYSA